MKTLIIIMLTWVSILLFKPTDYRDNYVGNYVCKEIHQHLNTTDQLVRDTLNYTLQVIKSAEDSMLTINSREKQFNVKLIPDNFRDLHIRCFGNFSGDSIYLKFIPSPGPTSYIYFGKK